MGPPKVPVMDDDQIMQCQLELMHALQSRKPLKLVKEEERPLWIGGRKANEPPPEQRLGALQSEFLASSLAMQGRLRPRFEQMEEIRKSSVYDEHWRGIQKDLRDTVRRQQLLGGLGAKEPKLLYQLDQTLEKHPGWKELQQEIRCIDRHQILQPVDFDGFYIVHPCTGGKRHPEE